MNFITSVLCLSSLLCVVFADENGLQSLKLPYNVILPHEVQSGWSVDITGFVMPHADNFTVDFGCLPSKDIAFHLKPYFVNPKVVRNYRKDKNWGTWDIRGNNPLTRSQPFQVKVTVENSGFKVDLNNNFFCNYEHHIQFHRITNLHIYGDITLTSVQF